MNNEELQKNGEIYEENLIDTSDDFSEEDFDDVYEEAIEYTDEEYEKIEVLEISEEEAEDEIQFENDGEPEEEESEEPEETQEQSPRKPKSKGSMIFSALIAVFCLIVFGTGAANILAEDREFSESENRVLAGMPSLSLYSLTKGTFTDDFETYLTDQFIFRDKIISLKTFFERITGKKNAGGVYIGKDGYLFSEQAEFGEASVAEITGELSAFAESFPQSRFAFILSPNSSYVNSDKLPDNLKLHDQKLQIQDVESYTESEKILWINPADLFTQQEDRESLFYRTDHHWTTRAAYVAFTELMTGWEKDISAVNFRFLAVADDFQGTLSSRSGVLTSYDTVEICVPENSDLSYVVTFDSEEKRPTLFDGDKLEEKNKYEVFLGGNYGKVVIDTTSESKDTLLIIKDSYANCMIPMLTPFFAKIVVIDPRYFTESLRELAEENAFTHTLFLYNMNTFLEDRDLAECLGK